MDYLIKVVSLIKKKINKNLEIAGVLLTKVHPRTNIAKDFEEEVKAIFSDKVYKTKINLNVKIQEAQSERVPIIYFDDKAKAAIQYMQLAREILVYEQ